MLTYYLIPVGTLLAKSLRYKCCFDLKLKIDFFEEPGNSEHVGLSVLANTDLQEWGMFYFCIIDPQHRAYHASFCVNRSLLFVSVRR